jgi:hypothetical protein|tara:strand:- start:278 stop:1057 length:780 start_codon:yes stop_codon:yes gene_type:complete
MSPPRAHLDQLDEVGCVALPGFCDPATTRRIATRLEELFESEGEAAGSEFKPEAGCRRLANLADKDDLFRQLMVRDDLLAYAGHVLGPHFKLSSLNARSINPGCQRTQPLHADMSAVPDERGFWVFNSLWMLDDFTADNGTVRYVPGTHHSGQLPADALENPEADHPDQELVTGQAGTVLLMNAHLWHGGLPNRTGQPRRALHIFFARSDRPQQQYQKQLLSAQTQAGLTDRQRQILALDDPENDAVSLQPSLRSGFLK